MEVDGSHVLRAAPRYKLFYPTEITSEGVSARAHLLNLSVGGALLFASNPPTPGAMIKVRCGTWIISARVVWKNQDRFGVAFLPALSERAVDDMVAEQDAAVVAARAERSGHALRLKAG